MDFFSAQSGQNPGSGRQPAPVLLHGRDPSLFGDRPHEPLHAAALQLQWGQEAEGRPGSAEEGCQAVQRQENQEKNIVLID